MVATPKDNLKKSLQKAQPKTIAYFKSDVMGEKVHIVRVGNNIGWYWENKKDGKTYGDFIVYEPLVDRKAEKEIVRLKEKFAGAKSDSEKRRYATLLLDLTRRYESTRVKDIEQAYEVLIDQAEKTITEITKK